MPFKSEAQRKYLWANEPEIARDWTDTYGSKIQAAQGGRIGFYRGSPHSSDRGPGPGGQSSASNRGRDPGPGPGGQSRDRGGSLSTGSPHSGSWSGPTYSKPDTVTFDTGPHRGEGIGSQTFDINKRTIDRQNQYRQGAYQRAHPFLSKVRSGLGALGRGIGHVARNFNPVSLAFDNPLMKLLVSRYGRGNIKDLFQRNNQDDEEIDYNQLGLYTDRIGDAIGPGTKVGEDINVQETILPEEALRDEMFTEIPTLAAQGGLIGSVGGTSRQKYQEGNMVGAEMEGAEMEGAEMQSQEAIKELYDALIAEGLSPQEAMEKIKEIIASTQTEEPQSPMMGEEFPGQEFGRAPAAFGGIMDTYTGRRKYGLGSFIKKAVRKIKKIAKSPIGKAALMYAATAGLGALGAGAGRAGGWKGMFGPSNIMKNLGASKANLFGRAGIGSLGSSVHGTGTYNPATQGLLGKWGLTKGAGSMMPTGKGWGAVGAAATAAPFLMSATGNWEQDQLPGPNIAGQEFDFDYGQMRKDIASAVAGGDYGEFTDTLGKYGLTEGNQIPYWGSLAHGAEGGRVGYFAGGPLVKKGIDALRKFKRPIYSFDDESKMIMDLIETKKYRQEELMALEGDQLVEIYVREGFTPPKAIPNVDETIELKNITPKKRIDRQEGGLMDLGGMEKDYRNDGGFVPLGGEEKADDVPARLSKNEFVFTADAVRNAGGGDIDRGAEVMENVMKNLEGGGKISEESQGQGAQDMFEVSERLSEVV